MIPVRRRFLLRAPSLPNRRYPSLVATHPRRYPPSSLPTPSSLPSTAATHACPLHPPHWLPAESSGMKWVKVKVDDAPLASHLRPLQLSWVAELRTQIQVAREGCKVIHLEASDARELHGRVETEGKMQLTSNHYVAFPNTQGLGCWRALPDWMDDTSFQRSSALPNSEPRPSDLQNPKYNLKGVHRAWRRADLSLGGLSDNCTLRSTWAPAAGRSSC